MNKFTKYLLTILFIVFSFQVYAKDLNKQTKYPPYPDVWGYDILGDKDPKYYSSLIIGAAKNGDYLINYRSKPYGKNIELNDTTIHFFSRERKKFIRNTNDSFKYEESLGATHQPHIRQYVELDDGKIIDSTSGYKIGFKYPHNVIQSSYLRKCIDFDSETDEFRISVLGIYPHINEDYEIIPEKFGVYFVPIQMFKLNDNTFITYDARYHLFIRFDKDLKTKFKPQHTVKLDETRELKSNFYVLPYSKIEYFYKHVVKKPDGKLSENEEREILDKLLLDYLFDLEQNNNI